MSIINTRVPVPIFLLQIVAGLLFFYVGIGKFQQTDMSVFVFESLNMEPMGRYLIGSIEILVGLLLLTRMPALGAFLGLSVMIGALIAHTTVLGLSVHEDGGMMFMTLIFLLMACLIVLWFRRKELPIFGTSF